MNKFVELPLIEPLYSTYHFQGVGTATIVNNPSIRNWYLNQVMNLKCNRKFLKGFATPEISILDSSWSQNPYLYRKWFSTEFLQGYCNSIIRKLLDDGYYIYFDGIDDYYVKGKSWYKERHFNHDGCICGYNQKDKTYCIYAYDNNWIYQKFWTTQADFDAARKAMRKKGVYSSLCAIKPKSDEIVINPGVSIQKMREYLDSNMRKYPKSQEGDVYGIAVHDYIAMYVDKLYDGSIPYERMDRRVFRLIWEHKKAMLERLEKIEEALGIDDKISNAYRPIVEESNKIRMLYALYNMNKRDSVLPIIHNKLIDIKNNERKLLKRFIEIANKRFNETKENENNEEN